MTPLCINVKHPDFITIKNRLNIGEARLNNIIYDYMVKNQTEEWPSDNYILSKLEGINNEYSEEAMELWGEEYSTPKEFNNKILLTKAKTEALKYFPPEAVVTYQNNKGKYILNVTSPNIEMEYKAIKKKAIADGTFMKAPNGKDTKLTERQWLQVRSTPFLKWFGDWINDPNNASKVVDENGEPKVVYHSSNTYGITIFDSSKSSNRQSISKNINKSFFSATEKTARGFISDREETILKAVDRAFEAEIPLEEFPDPYSDDALEFVWNYIARRLKGITGKEVRDIYMSHVEKGENTEYWQNPNKENLLYKEFLNFREPVVLDGRGQKADKVLEQFKDIINSNKNIIINNVDETMGEITTIYLSDNNAPNQIKSATDNNGEFSTEDNNIYNNIRTKEYDVLQFLKDRKLIHTWNKQLVVNKGAAKYIDINVIRESLEDGIREALIRAGYPVDSVVFSVENGRQVLKIDKVPLKDILKRDKKPVNTRTTVENVFSNLSSVFPSLKEIKYISKDNLSSIRVADKGQTAFIKNNIVYIVQERTDKLTKEILYEECLHPFVNSLYKSNKELFTNLLKEATKDFKLLKEEIRVNYTEESGFTSNDRNQELVTQALSRYFKKERDSTTKSKSLFEQLADKFLNWIQDTIAKASYNPITGKYMLEAKDLSKDMTLEDLSKLINSNNIQIITELDNVTRASITSTKSTWARTSGNGYEVSTAGDSRFSALKASFNKDIEIGLGDVSVYIDKGTTIEQAYQKYAKESGKGKAPAKGSPLDFEFMRNKLQNEPESFGRTSDNLIYSNLTQEEYDWIINLLKKGNPTKEELEDFSYITGYKPLWKEWAKQNPELIEDLKQKTQGKVLTDKFANTRVSQARALSEILNETSKSSDADSFNPNLADTSKPNPKTITINEVSKLFNTDMIDSDRYEVEYSIEPWKEDKSKQKYIAKIYLKGHRELGHFEVVADTNFENTEFNNEYSVHFKTATDIYGNEGIKPSTRKERALLYAQLRDIIPLGAKVSTWGEVSPGGQIALEKVGKGWKQVGLREVKDKKGNDIKVPIFQKPIEQEMSPLDKFIERQNIIKSQVVALMSNNLFTANEIGKLVDNIAFEVSDIISQIMADPAKAIEYFGKDVNISDIENAESRIDAINAIGWSNLIQRVRDIYDNSTIVENGVERTKYSSIKTIRKANAIQKSWDAIMQLCVSRFKQTEGISIGIDSIASEAETTKSHNEDINAVEDNDAIAELYGTLQEGWQIDSRTQSVVGSMSSLVKSVLHGTTEYVFKGYDKDGNPITEPLKNEFGGTEHRTLTENTNNLLQWFEGVKNIDDMIAVLKNKIQSDPWVSTLIPMLEDTSGAYSYFQNEFFTTFYKPFQLYDVITTRKGKLSVMPANTNNILRDIVKSIKASMTVGQHLLFTPEGVSKDAYDRLQSVYEDLSNQLKNGVNAESLYNSLGTLYNIIGLPVNNELLYKSVTNDNVKEITKSLGHLIDNIKDHIGDKEYKPFDYEENKKGYIGGNIRGILTPIANQMEASSLKSFYDSGKMYQSYVIPSYLTNMFARLKDSNIEEFKKYITKEFGNYPWFKEDTGDIYTGWKNEWLHRLVNNKEARDLLAHKVNLNMDKKNYMRGMTPSEYVISVIAEFYSENKASKNGEVPAWYRLPILSNKPSSEFIRFYSYRSSDYKDIIANNILNVFCQEVSRIQTVRRRNRSISDVDFIKNFDINGREFRFLDFLNDYLDGSKKNSELGKLINNAVKGNKALDSSNLNRLGELVKEEITKALDDKVYNVINKYKAQGLEDAICSKVSGINKSNFADRISTFIWNDTYAQIMIQELLITDPAYYKDADDIQKRIAQVHAPGIRPNIMARDQYGRRVSDGIQRSVVFTDLDGIVSSTIDNIKAIFDKKIKEASESLKLGYTELRDQVIAEYSNINVTDAQAYTSPSAYRKKMIMLGKWNSKFENVYQRLVNGTYTFDDLKVAFQPLKPFMYSQNSVDMNTDNVVLNVNKVPYQNKNAEYLLIMADALMRGTHTEQPNILVVLSDIMEESHLTGVEKDKIPILREDGIDTMQFNSAVKSGESGAISLREIWENSKGYDKGEWYIKAKSLLESKIYSDKTSHTYNDNHVNYSNYENYSIQQEVPQHYKDHSQAQGSQERYIIISDLLPTATFKVGKDRELMSAKDLKLEYESLIEEGINEDIASVRASLQLDYPDPIVRRKARSKIIQEEINSSSRYGIDLWLASCIDKATGEFIIPEGDPIQEKRIEQLLNSIIKNRVNKQKLPGGPVVQVSNFGASKRLHMRYYDKSGTSLVMTKDEFLEAWNKKDPKVYGKYTSYDKYLEENQGGFAYNEVLSPIPSDEFYEKFNDGKGGIDMQAVENCDPELLYSISNRIPTQEKYGIERNKTVGFLPKEAGEVVMYPYELTSKDDSDYDVDKRYIQIKRLPIKTRPRNEMRKKIFEGIEEYYKKNIGKELSTRKKKQIYDAIDMVIDNPNKMQHNDKLSELIATLYRQNAYYTTEPSSRRDQRNNRVIDIMSAVLSHESNAAKVLTPGNFNAQKKFGYLVEAYRQRLGSWESLKAKSTEELKALVSKGKNLIYFDTQTDYYKQNLAGSEILGAFAVQRIAHAALEGNAYHLELSNENLGIGMISIGDTVINDFTEIDASNNGAGESIGEILGAHIGASADTAKDPFLGMMNINSNTVSMVSTMFRLGIPYETTALFMSTNVISEMLAEYERQSLTKNTSLTRIVTDTLRDIKENIGNDIGILEDENLSEKEMLQAINTPYSQIPDNIKIKILNYYTKLSKIVQEIKGLNFATRFNSISNAVGPLIIDNLITEYKTRQFSDFIFDGKTGEPITFFDVLDAHPILKGFYNTLPLARDMFGEMPANSREFRGLLDFLYDNRAYNDLYDTLHSDRALLSKFSDFFQSYLLINDSFDSTGEGLNSPVINEGKLNYYINEFPTSFIAKNYYEKFKDNAFIQNTKLKSTSTGETYLNIETTGLDNSEKEKLSNAWYDLYKSGSEGKKLANDLFVYYFFRRGIGFSPETGMGLLPIIMKMNSKSYLDTYRRIKGLDERGKAILIDQFVRNNADNKNLVPQRDVMRKDKSGNPRFNIFKDSKGDTYVASTKKDVLVQYSKLPYFTAKLADNKIHLFQRVKTQKGILFKEVDALGNNGEYLEISKNYIGKSLANSFVLEGEEAPATPQTPTTTQMDTEEGSSVAMKEENLKERKMNFLLDLFSKASDPKATLSRWGERARKGERIKDLSKFLTTKLKEKNIEVTEQRLKNIIEEIKLC